MERHTTWKRTVRWLIVGCLLWTTLAPVASAGPPDLPAVDPSATLPGRGDEPAVAAEEPQTGATYTYDAAGRRVGMSDGSGSTTWQYDARGRLTEENKRVRDTTYTTRFLYDAADRVTRIIYPSPGYEEVNVDYNAQGLPRRVYSSVEYVSAASYDAAGRLLDVTRGNGLVTHYTYHPWEQAGGGGRLARIALGNLLDLNYAYDSVGNVTAIGDTAHGQRLCFTYDALDRLLRAFTGNSGCTASGGAGGGTFDEAYAYSLDGNLLRRGNPANPNDGLVAYVDPNHAHAATAYRGNGYAYGSNGNQYRRILDGITYDLAYDADNRLAQVTRQGAEVTSFLYDGDGQRVEKRVQSGGGAALTATTVTIGSMYESSCVASDVDCSGRVDIRDVQRVASRWPGTSSVADMLSVAGLWGTVSGGAQVVKHYYLGGQLIATRRAGVLYYVHGDHLGSVSLLTDASGQVVPGTNLLRHPFGTVRAGSEYALLGEQSFTGQRVDLSTGLDYYGARYYDPILARFIQPDTVVPGFANPQAFNRYSYALNSPVGYADPSGHAPQDPNDSDDNPAPCATTWCWQNRWYSAHGFGWNAGTTTWDIAGTARFYDRGILDDLLAEAGTQAVGPWAFDQLSLVGQAVVDLYKKIGSTDQLNALLGKDTVTIRRYRDGILQCYQMAGCAWASMVWLYDPAFAAGADFARGTVVHELAHIIDSHNTVWYRSGWLGSLGSAPSRNLAAGGLITDYSSKNANEYWAEAVTDWVYGERYRGPYSLPGSSGPRARFALSPGQADWIERFLKGWGW